MAQTALKQDQDGDADGPATGGRESDTALPDTGDTVGESSAVETVDAPAPALRIADNPVKRAIDEFRALIDEMDDLREVLRAHGIPLRTTRMIVELGIQKKPDKQAVALDSAMEQAEQSFGEGCLSRSVVENHIATIVNLERDFTHARSVAREEGLDAQALSMLTQMVQQNPGDGGAKAVNTLLGYAVAYGVSTEQLNQIVGEMTRRPDSVLPQIPARSETVVDRPVQKWAMDALIGALIGVAVIWLLL